MILWNEALMDIFLLSLILNELLKLRPVHNFQLFNVPPWAKDKLWLK